MKTGISNRIFKVLMVNFCLLQLMIGAAIAQTIVADAGPDMAYETGSVIILDGSNSYDIDGQVLTYSWYMAKKPVGSLAVLTNSDSETPEFLVDVEGVYILTLTVINGDNLSAADTVKIQVCPQGVYHGDYYIETQDDLEALSGYTEVSGNLSIKSGSIKNLDALSCLTSIGGNLSINDNYSLENIDGLKNLKAIKTNLSVGSYFGTINMNRNSKLKNIEGLKNLTSANRSLSLSINNHPQLETINGLRNISSVSAITISDNPSLTSLTGCENMDITGSVTIERNITLTDLTALSSVTSLYWLRLAENDALADLSGLENLATLSTQLIIRNNKSLTNLDALSSLCSVGQNRYDFGDLTYRITDNARLCTDKAEALKLQVANCPTGGLEGTTVIAGNMNCN